MSNTVVIGGVEVDITRPCDVLRELKKAQLTLATGGAVSMTRFDQDEVRFSPTNADQLQSLISIYQRECDRESGRNVRRARRVNWN